MMCSPAGARPPN